MTRNLPEPSPESSALAEGRRKAHAAVDELLERAFLHRVTGKMYVTLDLNEGGVRAVKIGTEEVFKSKS